MWERICYEEISRNERLERFLLNFDIIDSSTEGYTQNIYIIHPNLSYLYDFSLLLILKKNKFPILPVILT